MDIDVTHTVSLSCQQVAKTYTQGPEQVPVLNNLDLQVASGERLAIVGASGSGKSTLLNILGGLDEPSEGAVVLAGHDYSTLTEKAKTQLRNAKLGFVYQFHHLLPEFTALENAAMPLLIAGIAKKSAYEKALHLLARVGLADRANHKPSELSGGERQRVAIARALACDPACVLMDEPTGNLDSDTASSIEALMLELNKELNTSFVVVTHDRDLASRMDRTLELKHGQLHALGETA